ncbi:MAG TPA: thioredoxin domain-containing protein [bacterium]|nr:thioredoxin domain-containing protein [bacterium]
MTEEHPNHHRESQSHTSDNSPEGKPNRLIHEKSPYLLQHAYNPVNWYPWGEEAFREASRQNKMVFVSIGYATCHWCHVMERESFEDETTAEILNGHFVSVKVDREERPDIDAIYMDAVHSMGQQGGWPLNIFLTPDAKPIAGGTYFPSRSMHGRRSFTEVLAILIEVWSDRRKEALDAADDLVTHLRDAYSPMSGTELPDRQCVERAVGLYERLFDSRFGGFRTDSANKFPPNMALRLLMDYFYRSGRENCLDMCVKTLVAMKTGGIYDQVGGGLCRYSTDHQWLVPHFEKMLYDNALFLSALADCYQLTQNRFFRQAAYDVMNYIRRDMRTPEGAIASAEDADSEGKEGAFYLWSLSEFRTVTKDDSDVMENFWGLAEEGNFEGMNILHEEPSSRSESHALKAGQEMEKIIGRNRERLLTRRNTRPRPLRDDKVLTSWNCLYIQALARAGRAFHDVEIIREAELIHSFVNVFLVNSEGRLLRRYREEESAIYGYLSDYSEMALASLELFRSTFQLRYVESAVRFVNEAVRLFLSDSGSFYETGSDAPALIRRTINAYDGVEPSGNSSMAKALCALAFLGIDSVRYLELAEGVFRSQKDQIQRNPMSCPALLQAFLFFALPKTEVVLIGSQESHQMQESLQWLNQDYRSDLVVVVATPENLEQMKKMIPLLEGKKSQGDYVGYVCRDMTCQKPCQSWADLKAILTTMK